MTFSRGTVVALFLALAAIASAPAATPSTAPAKPVLKVEKDGLPSGHDTPEGAACDLARAFINRDAKLFHETCIPPFGGGEDRKAYEQFLQQMDASITSEAKKETPSPGGPKSIGKVFAARYLSKQGPGSAAYALYNFDDVMFVDVGVFLQNGKQAMNRTMVIKVAGKWFVDPAPDDAPLLSVGLNDESPSTQDFTEVYDVQKKP